MADRVVVTGYVGSGDGTGQDPYRADVDRTGSTACGIINLKGHPKTDPDALCLAILDYPAASRLPSRQPGSPVDRLIDIGENADTTLLSVQQTTRLASALGIVTPAQITVGELVVLAPAQQSRLRERRGGIINVEINKHILRQQAVIRGGAFATDAFPYSNGVLGTVSSGAWIDSFNAHDVVSNQIDTDLTTENNSASSVWSTTFTQKQYAQASCTLGDDFSQIGPMARALNNAFTGYTMYWRSDSTYKIIEWSGGSDTELVTVATTLTGTRTIRIEADGSSLVGYANGIQVLSVTDSTLTGSHVGLASYHSPGVNNALLDNWEGGDLPDPPNPFLVDVGALSAEASTTALGPVALPAGVQLNDIMVMACMGNGAGTFTGPGDGWAQFGTAINSANQSTDWFWKRHDGSETNPTVTTSWTMSTTLGGYARIWAFRNCIQTGSPFEDTTMNGTPTTSTTPASAAIDTIDINRLAVCIAMIDDDPAFSSGNPPALWSGCGANASSTTGGDALFAAIQRAMPTAAAVAAVNVGTLPGADYWRTITFALIPPPAAAPVADSPLIFGMDTAVQRASAW